DRILDPAAEKIVVERLDAIPIRPRVPIAGRLLAMTPGRVGDRPLDDHAHPARGSLGQYELDRFLVRDVHGDLHGVERAAFDRIHRFIGVGAASDEARLPALASLVDYVDRAAVSQTRQRRAVELDYIDVVGAQVLETALDAPREHRGFPVRLRITQGALGRGPKRRVATFGHQDNFGAPPGNRLADQRLAIGVALGRIDQFDAGVERGVQDFIDGLLRDGLIANFGAAEAKGA